jgi:uncharacterized protein (DUF305 family)
MQTKPLVFGIVGFILGGLLVSIAATTFEKPKDTATMSMSSTLVGKTGSAFDGAFDEAFVSGMITHHQDAIDMARMADSQAQHQEVKDLSKAIIETQQKEIDQMRQWQKDWGYTQSMMGGSH